MVFVCVFNVFYYYNYVYLSHIDYLFKLYFNLTHYEAKHGSHRTLQDILFDARVHRVKKFILHTNFPGHYDFNM